MATMPGHGAGNLDKNNRVYILGSDCLVELCKGLKEIIRPSLEVLFRDIHWIPQRLMERLRRQYRCPWIRMGQGSDDRINDPGTKTGYHANRYTKSFDREAAAVRRCHMSFGLENAFQDVERRVPV